MPPATLSSLPLELLDHILTFTPSPFLARYHLSLTSRAFYHLLSQDRQPTKDELLQIRYHQILLRPDSGRYHHVCYHCYRIRPFYAFLTEWDAAVYCINCLSNPNDTSIDHNRITQSGATEWLSINAHWCRECSMWELYSFGLSEDEILIPLCERKRDGWPGKGLEIVSFVERLEKFESILPPVEGTYGARNSGTLHLRECLGKEEVWRGAPWVQRSVLAGLEKWMRELEERPIETRKRLLKQAMEDSKTAKSWKPEERRAVVEQISRLRIEIDALKREAKGKTLVGKIQARLKRGLSKAGKAL